MPGTHRCGRIDHVMVGSQQGADLKRVELLKQRFPVTPVELNQGYYTLTVNKWNIGIVFL